MVQLMQLPRTCVAVLFLMKSMVQESLSFEFPKFPTSFGPFSFPLKKEDVSPRPQIDKMKELLIEAVSGTNNGKSATAAQQLNVLERVQTLETLRPAPDDVLTSPDLLKTLDGVWYLQYTSPSKVGDSDSFPDAWKPVNVREGLSQIDDRPFLVDRGALVSAAGIPVETANRVVKQIFNVTASRVRNEINLSWGRVEVEGTFRKSDSVSNRAIVGFDSADIYLDSLGGVKIELGWIFKTVLPLVRGGSRDNGWIETTFVDDDIRIARGNRGTLFILTRDPNVVKA